MAKCPACEHDVVTPFFLNVDKWRWLACPHCAARLERKYPRYVAALPSFLLAIIALGTMGHRFATLAEVLMVAIFVVMLAGLMRPQLQLRKPLPKPEITLNINGRSN
jgi:hypothetical protein